MNRANQTSAFELGRQHADLFLGFSCFVHEQSRQQEVDGLFFCTREGVFFKAVYDELFGDSDNVQGRSNTGLLEISRLSSFAPSLLSENSVDFTRLFGLYKKQSAESLLVSLGLSPDNYIDLVKKHGIETGEKFQAPDTDSRFNKFLTDREFLKRIRPQLELQRSAILDYLNSFFADKRKIGFVEIGWRGTTQNSIAKLFPDKTFLGFYLGLALEREIMNFNCSRLAYGPDHNLNTADRDLLDAINVLEFTCLSNGGSAEAYFVDSDGPVKVKMRHVPEEDRCVEAFSLPFQQGVLAVAQEADTNALLREHSSGNLKAKAMEKWRGLLKQPDSGLVKAYFSLKSNEQFGHGVVSDQSTVPSFSTVLLAPFIQSRRRELITYLTYSQWAEGMLHRTDLALHSRVLFYLLMKSALVYKVLVHSITRASP